MMWPVSSTAPPQIHPELATMARVLPRGLSPRSMRLVRRLEALQVRAAPMVQRWSRRAGRDPVEVVELGAASVRVHRPSTPGKHPAPGLVWIHGGGYVIGTAAQDDDLCRRIADELGAVVASVEYRRAPEHPYPAPVEDCHDALVWLADQDGVDRDRIAIGGASAGGGLAASLAFMARDRQQVQPVLQLLVYPMLDDRTVLRTDVDERGFRLWNNSSNELGWWAYLGVPPGSDLVPADAVPARRDDLAGLAPAWIGVGTLDLFHDEDLAYAAALRDAGVSCELDVVEGVFHAFDRLAPKASVTRSFMRSQLDALTAAFEVSRTG